MKYGVRGLGAGVCIPHKDFLWSYIIYFKFPEFIQFYFRLILNKHPHDEVEEGGAQVRGQGQQQRSKR